jgi:nucleoid-associated protein YgaU
MFGRKDKETKGPDLGAIQRAVQSAATIAGVRNLTARQGDNAVEIHGVANDNASKQNVMRAITEKVGDTAGVINLIQVSQEVGGVHPIQPPPMPHASTQTGPNPVQARGGPRTHTVKKGETLTHIARHYYGKASEFNKIFEANRDQLKDPDKIREGMTLNVP